MDDLVFRMMELKAKGFYCSQILTMLALESQEKENPDLVRAMAGLAFGVGIGEVCGALTGGHVFCLYTPARARTKTWKITG